MKIFCTILSFLFISTIACGQIYYEDIAGLVGIDHTYLLNNSGGGVSFADFDGNGWDDITLATGPDELIQFYRNEGGNFTLIAAPVDNRENVKSVLWADYDNDGDKDFYAAAFGGTNRLYNNDGNFNFTDVTFHSGLPSDAHHTFGANWADYNRDGWLDLYYGERKSDADSGPNENRLWRNNGNGTFSEVTLSSGAQDSGKLPFCAAFFDMDNDKWPDIYIANDKKTGNTLLKNNGDGSFTDVGEECQADISMDAMSVTVGDYDNNGLLDIYVTNIPDGSILLTNEGIEEGEELTNFMEEAAEKGVKFEGSVGWGANFMDADNDGWLDLYVSGMLIGTDVVSSSFYYNDGTGSFTKPDFGFVGDTVRSYTNAIGDIDNDGFTEIMVNNSEMFNSQLWKTEPGTNNFIQIRLTGTVSNRDGVGSTIKIYTGERYQMRYTHCGIAYQGQNSFTESIGLGMNPVVDSIVVTWPTGHVDILKDIPVNQRLDIVEGQTTDGIVNVDEDIFILSSVINTTTIPYIQCYPNPATEKIYFNGTEWNNSTYYLINHQGQTIQIGNITSQTLLLPEINSGLYFIILKNGGEMAMTKFVKI